MDPIPVRLRGATRGFYSPDEQTYYRVADRQNFCRKYNGWGIQAEILEWLRARGCQMVVIDLEGQGRAVEVPLALFFEMGVRATLNQAEGEHIFLHTTRFADRDPKLPRRAVLWTSP